MGEVTHKNIIEPKDHHKQLDLCKTRPPYRQGRKLTAVKVYTINDESQHVLVFGVPKIKLLDDLKRTCLKFGTLKSVRVIPNYPDVEEFTEVYHVHYLKLSSARFAKKKLDTKSFYGGILHVCYAPELESVNETREKLVQRRKEFWDFKQVRTRNLVGRFGFGTVRLEPDRSWISSTVALKEGITSNDKVVKFLDILGW